MNSNSILCLLPLLTSVLALPAADLLDHVLDPSKEHLLHLDHVHPHHQQQGVVQHQAADSRLKQETEKAAASNGESVEERATDCALFLCIRLLLNKLNLHLKHQPIIGHESNFLANKRISAMICACPRDASTTNSTYPWLINNKNAR